MKTSGDLLNLLLGRPLATTEERAEHIGLDGESVHPDNPVQTGS
jgi:hypothetical protein